MVTALWLWRGLLLRGKVEKCILAVQTAASCSVVDSSSVSYSCQIFWADSFRKAWIFSGVRNHYLQWSLKNPIWPSSFRSVLSVRLDCRPRTLWIVPPDVTLWCDHSGNSGINAWLYLWNEWDVHKVYYKSPRKLQLLLREWMNIWF